MPSFDDCRCLWVTGKKAKRERDKAAKVKKEEEELKKQDHEAEIARKAREEVEAEMETVRRKALQKEKDQKAAYKLRLAESKRADQLQKQLLQKQAAKLQAKEKHAQEALRRVSTADGDAGDTELLTKAAAAAKEEANLLQVQLERAQEQLQRNANSGTGGTQDDRLCVVCIDAVKNVLLEPCRHVCLCLECSRYDTAKDSGMPSLRVSATVLLAACCCLLLLLLLLLLLQRCVQAD